jgi:hypothetical protein
LKTRCGQDAGAEEAGDVLAGLPVGPVDAVTADEGAAATLARGTLEAPAPRPREHPVQAAVTARAIATDRLAAGNARFVILPITTAMVRTARTCRSPIRDLTIVRRPPAPR